MIEIILQFQKRGGENLQRDDGPMYTESNFDELIVEPINGLSAALFLLIVAYFAWKIRGEARQHPFMVFGLIVLLIGGIGGTIYHLFRVHPIFLHMDWLPIMILCMAAAAYFYKMAGASWLRLGIAAGIFVGLSFAIAFSGMRERFMVNINYGMMATIIVIPVSQLLYQTRFFKSKWIFLGILSFVLALGFRMLDFTPWVQENLDGIGTHFLWHVFGGMACFSIFQYVYQLDKADMEALKVKA